MASKRDNSPKPVRSVRKATDLVPMGYQELLGQLKERIRSAQLRAAVAVNRELIELYWQIGQSIVERQRSDGWGKSVVERLAKDLQIEFPGMSGFSPRNVWRMRAFYLAYTEEVRKLPRAVAELDGESLPRAVAEIPWGHNADLLEKIKNPVERLWYAHAAVQKGWSRPVLVHWIESELFSRQGKAQTNFEKTLRGRRPASPPRRQAVHRHHPVQVEKSGRCRIRAARSGQARRRVQLYHEARRVTSP